MNSKQTKTLRAVFSQPTPANIVWDDIETPPVAAGCAIVEGAGSRVTFVFDGQVESFHRPHPAKEAKRYQVRQAKALLASMGIEP